MWNPKCLNQREKTLWDALQPYTPYSLPFFHAFKMPLICGINKLGRQTHPAQIPTNVHQRRNHPPGSTHVRNASTGQVSLKLRCIHQLPKELYSGWIVTRPCSARTHLRLWNFLHIVCQTVKPHHLEISTPFRCWQSALSLIGSTMVIKLPSTKSLRQVHYWTEFALFT